MGLEQMKPSAWLSVSLLWNQLHLHLDFFFLPTVILLNIDADSIPFLLWYIISFFIPAFWAFLRQAEVCVSYWESLFLVPTVLQQQY